MSGLFGLETSYENSAVIIQPVPWEVTTSYGDGTSLGPQSILEASPQLDLYDYHFSDASALGIHLDKENAEILKDNQCFKKEAQKIRKKIDEDLPLNTEDLRAQEEINQASIKMNQIVYDKAVEDFAAMKIPGLIGGDHSSPEGLIKAAVSQFEGNMGVLHIDAHADLRKNYQGFVGSHASIMRNIMGAPERPAKLVQVGIRDFCAEEWDYIHQPESPVSTFFNRTMSDLKFSGKSWKNICEQIIKHLPRTVHVSVDIDGFSPDLCPNTGTPVPGGISYDEWVYLLKELVGTGRTICSFDLVEVAPGNSEWDGNVGARVLYQLAGWALASQQKLSVRESHGL